MKILECDNCHVQAKVPEETVREWCIVTTIEDDGTEHSSSFCSWNCLLAFVEARELPEEEQ